ncbi:SGNH/GDSL hydrolase family protein [Catellatospora vulcania]|uniref:SGNH/GDSL hydrolase family protein n=1 Tax=Catellatospora vulcania TaxID=1460450 RepID=UPI0012D47C19|nr:SGNH/GDSL hydrolase family protein [Catellatospora vulcania]
MSPRRWRRAGLLAAACTAIAMLPQAVQAAPPAPSPTADPAAAADASPKLRGSVDPARRDTVLRKDWAKSPDVAWTTSGDATGFHVMTATAASGYSWRTVATLSEPGFDTDQWIGNACLTGSAKRVVVVYAPRTFTNKQELFDRGGFTAVVDLASGRVTKVPVQSSLAYFNPGCGVGETALISQFGGAGKAQTRLLELDAARGKLATPITTEGQLTSAVPTRDGIVAAGAGRLFRVARDGGQTEVAPTTGVAYLLKPDADGGVVFLEHAGDQARVRRLATAVKAGAARTLAEGKLADVDLAAGAAGRVFITGKTGKVASLPGSVRRTEAPRGATFSSHGDIALNRVHWLGTEDPRVPVADPGAPRAVRIDARVLATGADVTFGVGTETAPSAATASGGALHPRLAALAGPAPTGLAATGPAALAAATGDPSAPVEDERYCSVPRNDPRNQALQPKPRQVEWAINQAITNTPYAARPANWMNLGMPAYSPLSLFPRVELVGGGRVPAQVYLGIVAQESNMWQASRLVVPGVTGNPLIGNYYGTDVYDEDTTDDWDVRWDKADCGYGVGQVTDGMRLAGKEKPGEVALPYNTQRAVALDFAANVAAGVRILQDKWNQTRNGGLTVHNGDARKIENWFYAIWAYNSGFYPQSDAYKNNGAWGVGWGNNPANPNYPANRLPFLEGGYNDARIPQFWPYQEKVIGFAAYPPTLPDSATTEVAAYRAAWWGGTNPIANRTNAKPPVTEFCDASNDCIPGSTFVPDDPAVTPAKPGPCAHKNAAGQYDLHCWYHQPSTWKADCPNECGNEVLRFDPGYAYQDDAVSFVPNCSTSGLPAGALVVDDVPNGTPSIRPGCTPPASHGAFALNFERDALNQFAGKVDFHQIGGGFGGHFWFAHTRNPSYAGGKMKVTGTWTLDRSLSAWTRVMVHIPDHGAHTRQATYEIDLGNGSFTKRRVVAQRTREHRWVSLGVFPVNGTPRVRLTTDTPDGAGSEDVAWDAVAFEALAGKPRHQIVALGDSYSSGEGASAADGVDYYKETDFKLLQYVDGEMKPFYQNVCHRSKYAWSRQAALSDDPDSIGKRADEWDPTMDYHLQACSGAQSENLLPYHTVPYGQPKPTNAFGQTGTPGSGELSQLDQGYLDENTTLVTLSIGGNDARFSKVFTHCVFGGVGLPSLCQDDTLDGEPKPIGEYTEELINGKVKDSIKIVLQEIHKQAPNAKIMLMGYPKLLENSGGCVPGIGTSEAPWLNATGGLMATRMSEAVDEVRLATPGLAIEFANPVASGLFDGKGVCGNPETINAVVTDLTPGEDGPLPDFLPEDWNANGASQQSLHPKISGARIYADIMQNVVRTKFGL